MCPYDNLEIERAIPISCGFPAATPVEPRKHGLGGLGVSGDSSCADHNIAWRTRDALDLDTVPAGVSGDPERKDNIVYDIASQAGQMPGVSAGGWGHPHCKDPAAETTIAAGLPKNE